MITAVHGQSKAELLPGYRLAQNVLNRLIQEGRLSQADAWNRPLLADESNEWMTERKLKWYGDWPWREQSKYETTRNHRQRQ